MSIPRHVGQGIVLAIIVAILGTQLVVGFTYRGKRTWPFVAYPMYRTPHYEGERLDHDWRTFVVFEDGRRSELDRAELGIDFWLYYKNIVNAVARGDGAALGAGAAHYCPQQQAGSLTLEVEDLGVGLGRGGPVFGLEPETLGSVRIPCTD